MYTYLCLYHFTSLLFLRGRIQAHTEGRFNPNFCDFSVIFSDSMGFQSLKKSEESVIRRNACETSVLELRKKREKTERKQRIICVPILHSQFFSLFSYMFLRF